MEDITSNKIVAMCSMKNERSHWITTLLKEQMSSPLWPGGNHGEQLAHEGQHQTLPSLATSILTPCLGPPITAEIAPNPCHFVAA